MRLFFFISPNARYTKSSLSNYTSAFIPSWRIHASCWESSSRGGRSGSTHSRRDSLDIWREWRAAYPLPRGGPRGRRSRGEGTARSCSATGTLPWKKRSNHVLDLWRQRLKLTRAARRQQRVGRRGRWEREWASSCGLLPWRQALRFLYSTRFVYANSDLALPCWTNMSIQLRGQDALFQPS